MNGMKVPKTSDVVKTHYGGRTFTTQTAMTAIKRTELALG